MKHQLRFQTLAVSGGLATVLQSRVNGGLALEINNGAQAALVSFSVGLILLSAYAILTPAVRAGVSKVTKAVGGQLHWWQVIGGTMGAAFVAVQSITVPLVGVAIFTIATIAAQTGNSLLVDRLGIGPAKVHFSSLRIVAAGLAIFGVAIAVSKRFSDIDFPRWAVLAALFIGALVAVQHALNGRVRAVAENAFSTAWLNFFFGVMALSVFNLMLWISSGTSWTSLPFNKPWLFLGGALGTYFIVVAASVIRHLGSLQFTLATTAGQLLGSLALDLLLPLPGAQVDATLLLGLSITAAAVVLAGIQKPKPIG
ncbi:MAG: hypothetical protein RL038_1017 [Actinomycetota bacterium]|jgi:transporter family-2 protein